MTFDSKNMSGISQIEKKIQDLINELTLDMGPSFNQRMYIHDLDGLIATPIYTEDVYLIDSGTKRYIPKSKTKMFSQIILSNPLDKIPMGLPIHSEAKPIRDKDNNLYFMEKWAEEYMLRAIIGNGQDIFKLDLAEQYEYIKHDGPNQLYEIKPYNKDSYTISKGPTINIKYSRFIKNDF